MEADHKRTYKYFWKLQIWHWWQLCQKWITTTQTKVFERKWTL